MNIVKLAVGINSISELRVNKSLNVKNMVIITILQDCSLKSI